MTLSPILHSHTKGQGDTIVMLHGYLSSSHYFKHTQARLAKTHTVISLDLLGFGLSPKPRGEYTYEEHIAAINATLDSLQVNTPFVLLGHSMGALIALRYGVLFPDRVRRLLLFNPPIFTDIEQMEQTHKASGRHYRTMLFSPSREGYWKALKLVPHTGTKHRPAINFADTVRMSRHAREGSYKHVLGGSEILSDLDKATMPVLLVNGKYDRVVYQENLADKKLSKNISLKTIESGHHPLVKDVATSEQLIKDFIT